MSVYANLGSPTDLMIIAGIVILLFGGSKIPQLAKGLGQGLKEFKTAMREDTPEEKAAKDEKGVEKAE